MPKTDEIDFEPEFAADGKIVDCLSGATLEDRPEERVRQRYLKVLHYDYGYAKNRLRREVQIMAGSSPVKDVEGNMVRADIVVYRTARAAATGDQGQIKFIVECKRPDVTTGLNQLVSYVFNTSAGGGVWTNGDDVQPFRRATEPANDLQPAPRIPRHDEEWDSIGRSPKSKLARPRDVRGLLRLCNNRLHGRGIDNDEEDLTMDMVRIILAKVQDEINEGEYPDFYITDEEYRSETGRANVAARVKKLFRTFASDNPGVFTEHENIGVSDSAIAEVVAVLQSWQIMTRLEDADEWDVMGSAYEQYTASHLKRARGQFFTNRLIVDFMVKAIDPSITAKALDPAGGSGGFLTSVLRHVRRKIIDGGGSQAQREQQLGNLRQRLFLIEISPRLVKIAKTAMLLNGDGHTGMTRGDSLQPYENLPDWIKARCSKGMPDVVLTNPPFAGVGEGKVTDSTVLANFQVGHRWQSQTDGSYKPTSDLMDGCPPELLFFERCLDWLAPGGHLGIVLPKSFLDTATYRSAREILFMNAKLLVVVNCHKNTFQPDTGVRTCLLILRRLKKDEKPPTDYEVFMAISQKIGRDSEGIPIFKVDSDGSTSEDIDHDLDEILADYLAFKSGNLKPSENRYAVKSSTIPRDTLNINPQFHSPHLNATLRQVQGLDGQDGWSVSALSQVEQGIKIYKGPRLRTENLLVEANRAEETGVEPYFTPSAVLQDKRDSVKWLDLSKASERQIATFEMVRVHKGDILVTRSGTIGRVAYITDALDGAIVSDDAIRVRITNPQLRAYVFAFLQSRLAQDQIRINEYGAIQQHLEPEHVAGLLIPIPDEWSDAIEVVERAKAVITAKESLDSSTADLRGSFEMQFEAFSGDGQPVGS
jgi:type I restriction enzyme M protein